ncbi:MAG TPA: hypothetical protein VE085_15155 [Burkholderiales bacterium]|nr:hypothetical protein [Burkholderiales bacterium]
MRLLILVLSLCPALVLAQARDATRGNTPPGMSQDGSGPADGAVKGGAILPGEGAGVPNKDSQTPAAESLKRCDDLQGSLREDCLAKHRSSAAGGTRAPRPRNKEVPTTDEQDLKSRTD